MSPLPSRKPKSRTTTTSWRPKKRSSTARASSKRKSTDRRPPQRVYLGLGSNLGDRRLALELALGLLSRLPPLRLRRVSSIYRTEPVGNEAQPDFYNAVAELSWAASPARLLAELKSIELALGRVARPLNAPREIDLDILDFGGAIRRGPGPILPHPRLASRRFVLAPLSEIAPGWRHPESGRTARALLAALPKRPAARRLPARPRIRFHERRTRSQEVR